MMSIGFMSAARTSNLKRRDERHKRQETNHLPLFSLANTLDDLFDAAFDLPRFGGW